MLANLHKLEDSGKLSSPKGDVSAKDIVTSIISAANRKMLRAAVGTKNKKESLSESDERSLSRQEDCQMDSRRESESVIHGESFRHNGEIKSPHERRAEAHAPSTRYRYSM
jgi:hypothetical protein